MTDVLSGGEFYRIVVATLAKLRVCYNFLFFSGWIAFVVWGGLAIVFGIPRATFSYNCEGKQVLYH